MSSAPIMSEYTRVSVEEQPAAGDISRGAYLTPKISTAEEHVLLVSPKAFNSTFTRPSMAPRAVGPTGRVRKSTVVLLCLAAFAFALLVSEPTMATIPPLPASVRNAYQNLNQNMPWTRRQFRAALHRPPRSPLKREDMMIRQPREEHLMTMIVLHDLKSPEQGQVPFHHLLAADFPFVKFVYPEGRNISVSIYGDERQGWYDVRDADDLHFDEDEQGMVESQRQINQLIREERDILIEAGKEPRIALAGFSQGASISLAVTLTSDEPIEALIMMSGYIPMPDKLRINSAVQQDVPVFWGHGRYDPDITVDHAAEDVKALRLPPYSLSGLRFRTYEVKHGWTESELEDIRNWFGDHVSEDRKERNLV